VRCAAVRVLRTADRRAAAGVAGFRRSQAQAAIGAAGPASWPDSLQGRAALEVRPGAPATRYLIGTRLRVAGRLLAEVPVRRAAPNDIAGTSGERARIAAARLAFGQAVRTAFTQHSLARVSEVGAVVVRHHPQRDEDNTWQTWITATCGAASPGARHWADARPWRAGGRQLSPASPTPPSARPSGTSCGDDRRARHAAIQSTESSAGTPEDVRPAHVADGLTPTD
jgi:hypothetical protein